MTERMTLEQFRAMNKTERRQPKKPRNQGEFDAQSSFFSIIDFEFNRKRYPFLKYIFAVPNGAFRDQKTAGKSRAEGQRAGVPDVVFPFQRRCYPGAYMENKFGDNTLSPAQKDFRDHLIKEGYATPVCYTVDQQIEFCEWFLGIELLRN